MVGLVMDQISIQRNNMIVKIFGIILIILSVLSIVPALVDPVGVVFTLIILMVSGVTALSGKMKYALTVLTITTLFTSYMFLNLAGWIPGSNDNEPLPEGISKVEDLSQLMPPAPDIKEIARELSQETGISYEELINAEVVANDKEPASKQAQAFMFLKFVSIPFIITVSFILAGYYFRFKSRNRL
jgi:uncharacterized membrane protein